MTFQIPAQDFEVLSETYVIRTKVPVEHITGDQLLLRIRNANLHVGDVVTVQCMSADYDRGDGNGDLLHEGSFRVVRRKEALKVHEISDRDTRQVMEVSILLEQVGDWWASRLAPVAEVAEEAEPAKRGPGRPAKAEAA